jgi:hypothetical protein
MKKIWSRRSAALSTVREATLFDWIPYNAPEFYDWKKFGFDTALMQPNYSFDTRATRRE